MSTNPRENVLPIYQHPITPLTTRQKGALMAALNPDRIANLRKGSSNLSYLEAWDVKATLIKVFGFGGFSAEVVESKIERVLTKEEAGGNAAWVVLCTATVRLYIHQLGAVYTETAVSSQAGAQIGDTADFAMKTAESDALKRAAIYLGTQFGLSLYDSGSTQDVVKVVLAEGQEWPPLNPDQKAQAALAVAKERDYIDAVLSGVDAHTARETVWGASEQQPTLLSDANAARQAQQPAPQGPPPGSSLSPEQYAETQAQIQRGLTMRAQQSVTSSQHDNQQSAGNLEPERGVDFAKLAQQDHGTSAVLEPDYSAEAEAYAAADGHHE